MQTRTAMNHRKVVKIILGLCFVSAVTLSLGACPPQDGGGGGYTLTCMVTPAGAGTVVVSPSKSTYESGEQVQITAQAGANYQFDHWQGGASGQSNPLTLTISGDATVEAVMVASSGGGDTTANKRVLPDTVEVTTDATGLTTLSGSGIPPSIPPGTVLISTRGEGQLLRVKSLATSSNGQVVVNTEQAALTDAIRNGTISLSVPFSADNAIVEIPAAASPGGVKLVPLQRTGKLSAAFAIGSHSIELEDWGKVTLDQLVVDIRPDFDITADIEDCSLKNLQVSAGANFHLILDASVEAYKISELLKKETTIGKVKWPNPAGIIVIGGVPVVYQVYLEVKVGAQVKFGDVGVVTAGFDFDTSARLGAQYDQTNGWAPLNELTSTLTPHTPQWGVSPITAQVYVQPEFGVKFFGVVGPSLSWKEYLELVGGYKYDELGAEVARGSECDFNINFKIVDGMPSYKYTHNLFKARQVLLARMVFRAEPEELGTVHASPSGLVDGFYLFTTPVSVSAEPNAGYEVAGWAIRELCGDGVESRKTTSISNSPINASKLFSAGIVPLGYGDSWSGAGTGSGPATYTLSTSVFPPDAGTIGAFPTQTLYSSGIKVLVTAIPNDAYTFHHWEQDLTGTAPTGTVTMTGNRTIRAVFASKPPGRRLCVPTSYPTIQAAIDAATYNDTVCIEAGTFSGDGFHDLVFPRDHITLDGAGKADTTINLANAHRLAEFDNLSGMQITDLTIANGAADKGGAIKIDMKSELALSNVRIHDCTSTSYGGAIYLSNNDSYFSADHCDFDHNQGYKGGAICLDLMPNDATYVPQLANCTFTSNTSRVDGGGLYAAGACNVDTCTFTSNTANGDGGGGLFHSGATITNCDFVTNTADDGGGLVMMNASVASESRVEGNIARYSAGGMKVLSGSTAESCVVTQNAALNENNASGGGGGIWVYQSNLYGCTVRHNTAPREGGGVHAYLSEVSNCTIEWNDAGWYGGGLFMEWGTTTGCLIGENRAGVNGDINHSKGGGIYVMFNATVANSNVQGNQAIDGEGGAIWADATLSSNIEALTITGIVATLNTARTGGGVYADQKVRLFNSDIEHNTASYRGGGVYVDRNSLVSGCTLSNNVAAQEGGAAVISSAIHTCSIEWNTANATFGGGVGLFKSTATDCTINNNVAITQGGGVWTGIECALTGCVILNNQVTGEGASGGGLACHGAPTLTGLTVSGNTPDNCNADCTGCP